MSTKKIKSQSDVSTVSAGNETIALTPDELAGLIREGVALEMRTRKENTFFNRRLKPFLSSLWQSRLAWFLFGFLTASLFFPFVKGGFPISRIFRNAPIINNLTADSPKTIAKNAPNKTDGDKRKRDTMATACQMISEQIRTKTISTKNEALSALTAETANVTSNPAWKETTNRIERLIVQSGDLDSLADLLDEIAEAFQ